MKDRGRSDGVSGQGPPELDGSPGALPATRAPGGAAASWNGPAIRVPVVSVRRRTIFPEFVLRTRTGNRERYCLEPIVARDARELRESGWLTSAPLLLLDTELSSALGSRGLHELRTGLADLHLVIVGTRAETATVSLNTLRSADGCVSPQDDADRLVRAFDTVLAGHLWFPRLALELMIRLAATSDDDHRSRGDSVFDISSLTPREAEIHQLMRHGLSNPQIAGRLDVSVNTVKKHLDHVFRKLGLHKRRQGFE